MKITIKIPDKYNEIDVQPSIISVREDKMEKEEKEILDQAANILGKIEKIEYGVLGKTHFVSIEKKGKYLCIDIDEENIINYEKRG